MKHTEKNSFSLNMRFQCTENWNEMLRAENGKHCQACDKTVVDFSQMSNDQIADYFRSAKGKTCGRIRKDQLKQLYAPPTKRKALWFDHLLVKLALTGILTLKLTDSNAQSKTNSTEQTEKDNSGKKKTVVKEKTVSTKKYISGKIVDAETRKPIKGASITIKNSVVSASSNTEGAFTIELPEDYKEQRVLVNVYAYNHTSIQHSFTLSTLPKKNWLVLLKYEEEILMGDIDINYEKSLQQN